MNDSIKLISAYSETNGTGVLDVSHAREVVKKARNVAQTDKMVAISMKGITSMSILTAEELCNEITKERGLSTKVAIVGSSPYINRIIGMGMRKAGKAPFTAVRTIKAVSTHK